MTTTLPRSSRILLAALAWAAPLLAAAAGPVHHVDDSGACIRKWLLCGPFKALGNPPKAGDSEHVAGFYEDHLAVFGGEAAVRPEPGQAFAAQGQNAAWIAHEAPDDVVVLDGVLSDEEQAMAYAYCELEAPRDMACLLALGTNDGVRAWVGGQEILDRPGARGLRRDEDVTPLLLEQGSTPLLLKLDEHGNRWEFCARILPFDTDTLTRRFRLLEVKPSGDGAVALHVCIPKGWARDLIAAGEFAVRPAHGAAVLWRTDWAGDPLIPIGVDAAYYGEYVLDAALEFKGGAQTAIEIPFTAGRRIEHELFAKYDTDYTVVLGPEASASEQWAAEALRDAFDGVSGATIPIQCGLEPAGAKQIIVGYNARTAALLGDRASKPAPGDEAFTYCNVGPTILIWGGSERGTMYGVHTFLERELGVRWYTPSVTVTPAKKRYAFTYLHHQEAPGVRVRNDFYYEAFDPIWAARNKVNGAMNYREQPGGVECYWGVHTFYPLMPPSEFFDAHPEYYSLIRGKRVWERAQLCLTNPDVLRICTERMRQQMRDNPQYLIYSLSQNDWRNPCQCEACQAIAAREESEAGPVIWFVNQVAEALEDEFPDKFIGTLAYQYTRKPCKTLRPRHNVVVRLCSIECCFAHDFVRCPRNASFVEDLHGWAAIAPHLYIWDYVVNFSHYIQPYPNFTVLQSNIQQFRDNHAIGIMEQAAYQSRGGEFAELRAYVLAKLLWDPECDTEAVINDFMHGYYGRAGQYVRAYFDLLHAQVTPETHIGLGLRPTDPLFSDGFVRAAEALFDHAEIVADNEAVRRRVEMARLPIMYLKCKRLPHEAKRDGTYARFCAIVEREGVTHYAERGAEHREAFHKEMDAIE